MLSYLMVEWRQTQWRMCSMMQSSMKTPQWHWNLVVENAGRSQTHYTHHSGAITILILNQTNVLYSTKIAHFAHFLREWPDIVWCGTVDGFRPKPLGLWHMMAESIEMRQYAQESILSVRSHTSFLLWTGSQLSGSRGEDHRIVRKLYG